MGEIGKCLLVSICAMVILITHGQAQEREDRACPHNELWKPSSDELKQILDAHHQWAEEWRKNSFYNQWAEQLPQGRANLCEADLDGVQLNEADLSGAQLTKAFLRGAQLN